MLAWPSTPLSSIMNKPSSCHPKPWLYSCSQKWGSVNYLHYISSWSLDWLILGFTQTSRLTDALFGHYFSFQVGFPVLKICVMSPWYRDCLISLYLFLYFLFCKVRCLLKVLTLLSFFPEVTTNASDQKKKLQYATIYYRIKNKIKLLTCGILQCQTRISVI